MTKEEIQALFNEVKSHYDGFLSPSQQNELWSEFGWTLMRKINEK